MKKNNESDGFTLIELMIAVAIVAILASVAYPSYLSHVDRSRRAEAMSALVTLASAQERFFTVNGYYASQVVSDNDAATVTELGLSNQSENENYTLSTVHVGGSTATYRVIATPPAGVDADCGTFSLSNIGVRWVSGNFDGDANDGDAADGDGDVADQDDIGECWR